MNQKNILVVSRRNCKQNLHKMSTLLERKILFLIFLSHTSWWIALLLWVPTLFSCSWFCEKDPFTNALFGTIHFRFFWRRPHLADWLQHWTMFPRFRIKNVTFRWLHKIDMWESYFILLPLRSLFLAQRLSSPHGIPQFHKRARVYMSTKIVPSSFCIIYSNHTLTQSFSGDVVRRQTAATFMRGVHGKMLPSEWLPCKTLTEGADQSVYDGCAVWKTQFLCERFRVPFIAPLIRWRFDFSLASTLSLIRPLDTSPLQTPILTLGCP